MNSMKYQKTGEKCKKKRSRYDVGNNRVGDGSGEDRLITSLGIVVHISHHQMQNLADPQSSSSLGMKGEKFKI